MTSRNGLPENTVYTDDGCDLHGHCLTCPLPACRYEIPPGEARRMLRMAELDRLVRTGLTVEQAALELGIPRRSAYRLRRRALGMAATTAGRKETA
jgi:hypothetical protein